MGYDVAAGLFTAEEVGAPHRRERLFALARKLCHRLEELNAVASNWREASGTRSETLAERPSGRSRRTECGGTASEDSGLGDAAAARRNGWPDAAEARRSLRHEARREGLGGSGADLANTERPERRSQRAGSDGTGERTDEDRQTHSWSGISDASLGNADATRLEGRRRPIGERTDELLAWPPGPAQHDEWTGILAHWPHLQPAISIEEAERAGLRIPTRFASRCAETQPPVRRVADGPSNRVDRLRACGNGVVPIVAAYAYRTLMEALRQDWPAGDGGGGGLTTAHEAPILLARRWRMR